MHLLQSLSETSLGRALIAYFFDLPRWTLASVLFGVALLPAYLALTNGIEPGAAAATLPAVPVMAGMINMSASQTAGNAPRFRDALAYPSTLFTVFLMWLGGAVLGTLLLIGAPLVLIFIIAVVLLMLLLIGVFAIFLPSQLKVTGRLIWRNGLVLAVSNPIIGLGILLLAVVGVWVIAISKGALIIAIPALWILMAAFTVDDRIQDIRSRTDSAA